MWSTSPLKHFKCCLPLTHLWLHACQHKLIILSVRVWATLCISVCLCDSVGSGGYFDGAVFIFSHNTLQQLQPILTSQTHLFSFMRWCQNSMATTLPVALGLLTKKRRWKQEYHMQTHMYMHVQTHTHSGIKRQYRWCVTSVSKWFFLAWGNRVEILRKRTKYEKHRTPTFLRNKLIFPYIYARADWISISVI